MIVSDMTNRLLERLGENPAAPAYYTSTEALNWLNAAQRIMVLLTLCLETTNSSLILAENPPGVGVAFYSMLANFPDWILPLRIRVAGGKKLTPARYSDLAAFDSLWSASPGPATHYALAGFDLLGVYQQPLGGTALAITYARAPVVMANPGDSPEVPGEYHNVLIDGAIPIMRAKEGGQEWRKTLPLWDRYLNGCQELGAHVRARNIEQGYDAMPIEISRLDRSKMLAEVSGAK